MASNLGSNQKKTSRRTMTLLYGGITAAIVIALLYFERIDVLYILATLGLVVLLLIVAFADLERNNPTEINKEL